MKFSSVTKAILMTNARKSPALRSCRTHLSREWPTPFAHIEQRQHGEGTVGVLGQAAIACLGEAPEALEGQERMLDLGAHRGLSAIALLIRRLPAISSVFLSVLCTSVLGLGCCRSVSPSRPRPGRRVHNPSCSPRALGARFDVAQTACLGPKHRHQPTSACIQSP